VTELKCGADSWRERVEKRIEEYRVLLQIRGKLKQQRTQLRAKRRGCFKKLANQIAAIA